MAEKHANIEELVYDDHNFNQHTAEGMELLEKSIRENKFGRSILIDKDNRIIAGNGIVEAATKTGTKKIRVIETDGDELIAVKRKDLSLDSQEGRRLALADNATSAANLKWDEKELKNAEKEWEVSLDDWSVPASPDVSEYTKFVDKFKPKLTTDDCYTPPAVYAVVLDYVAKRYDLTDKNVVRPFKPNGDYQNEVYAPNDVVVDNPPFSILSEVVKFYHENNIPFFLFAPALTLFGSCRIEGEPITKIVCGATVIYENGANVSTSFLTNMWGDGGVVVDGYLCKALNNLNTPKADLKRYKYPHYVINAARIQKVSIAGGYLEFSRESIHRVTQLEDGTQIYGGGFLISEKAAAEKAAAEKAAAVTLSEAEWAIIKALE